jgi:CRISPR/Cas system-associated protein Csm6
MSNLKPNTVVSVGGVLAIIDTRQAGCYRVEFADGTQRLCTRRMFVVEKSRELAINFWMNRYSRVAAELNRATATKHRVDRLVSKLRVVYVRLPGPQLAAVPVRACRSSVTRTQLVHKKITTKQRAAVTALLQQHYH